MADLKKQTIAGVKWTTVASVNNTLVLMLKLFILARILEKSDFGIIAIVLAILGFTEIFSNLGLGIGLIHKQEITQKQYSSVFWINVTLSILLYALIACLSPVFARYYNEPTLLRIIPLMGLQLIINALGNMFYTFKSKELEFRFISIVQIIGIYAGTLVTIALALLDFGVYSLVYGLLAQTFVQQITYCINGLRRRKVLFYCKLRDIADLLKIGGYQIGTQVLDYISNKVDVLIIGRFFGMEKLGVYNLAKEFVVKPIQVINPIVTNVATPAFAKFQDDLPRLQSSYLKVLKLLSSFNMPIFICLAVFAEPVVSIVYGYEMMEVAVFVRILAFWGLFNSIANPAGILMVAKGRTDLGFRWTVVRIAAVTSAIVIACHFTIIAVAWAQTLLSFLFLFLYWRLMVYKLSEIPLRSYIRSFSIPLAVSVALGGLFYGAMLLSHHIAFQIAMMCCFGLATLAAYWLFDRNFLKNLVSTILKR